MKQRVRRLDAGVSKSRQPLGGATEPTAGIHDEFAVQVLFSARVVRESALDSRYATPFLAGDEARHAAFLYTPDRCYFGQSTTEGTTPAVGNGILFLGIPRRP